MCIFNWPHKLSFIIIFIIIPIIIATYHSVTFSSDRRPSTDGHRPGLRLRLRCRRLRRLQSSVAAVAPYSTGRWAVQRIHYPDSIQSTWSGPFMHAKSAYTICVYSPILWWCWLPQRPIDMYSAFCVFVWNTYLLNHCILVYIEYWITAGLCSQSY